MVPADRRRCTAGDPGRHHRLGIVARALASHKDVAAADDLAGAVTYERMLVGALLMAKRFATIESAERRPPVAGVGRL